MSYLKFIFVFVLCQSLYSQNNDFIIIKHIGIQDKPIYPIAIIKEKSDTFNIELKMRFRPSFPLFEKYLNFLDTSSYDFIEKGISKYYDRKSNEKTVKGNFRPYGSLKIVRYVNNKEIYCFEIVTSAESYNFLYMIYTNNNLINNKSALQTDIERMKYRIKPSDLPCN